jgi:hypothetical protein
METLARRRYGTAQVGQGRARQDIDRPVTTALRVLGSLASFAITTRRAPGIMYGGEVVSSNAQNGRG